MSKLGGKGLFSYHVRKFLWEFPDLKYTGSHMMCLVCNKELLCWNRVLCKKHINTATHQYNKRGQRPYAEFIFDLIFMLSACNVPFNILEKEPFQQFWKKYNPTLKLPRRTTVRRYLPVVRERIENNTKSALHDKKLWLTVNETTDSKKHSVANVIVRSLNPLGPSPPYLLACKRLKKGTVEALTNLILSTLLKFDLSPRQVLMFVSDNTALMLLAGRFLKNVSNNLLHITCILHALHLGAETLRSCYPDVDTLIVQTRATFCKSPKRVREFHRQCPGIPEPPEPISTSWGAWLGAAFYYFKHFHKIKPVILNFDPTESVAIQKSQIKFQEGQVEADLQTIYINFVVLADALQKLQKTSISLQESLRIIDGVQTALQSLTDEKSISVKDKISSVLTENPDFTRLQQIYSQSASSDPLQNFRDHFNYAPITALDAEQSFTLYKHIFSARRTSLSETTVETFSMLQMFSRAHPSF